VKIEVSSGDFEIEAIVWCDNERFESLMDIGDTKGSARQRI
jgi:hypothetical protein